MVYTVKTSNIMVKRKTDESFIIKLADFYPLNPEMRGKGTGKKAPEMLEKEKATEMWREKKGIAAYPGMIKKAASTAAGAMEEAIEAERNGKQKKAKEAEVKVKAEAKAKEAIEVKVKAEAEAREAEAKKAWDALLKANAKTSEALKAARAWYAVAMWVQKAEAGEALKQARKAQQWAMVFCFETVFEILHGKTYYYVDVDEVEKLLSNLRYQIRHRFDKPTFAHICETLCLIKERLLTPESQRRHNKIRRVYVFEPTVFKKCNVKDLPIDQLDHIIFPCISIDDYGHVLIMDIWNSISKPFSENDGVDPQNKPFGNLPEDLGVVGQFKKLLIDQGKRFSLSLGVHTSHQSILDRS